VPVRAYVLQLGDLTGLPIMLMASATSAIATTYEYLANIVIIFSEYSYVFWSRISLLCYFVFKIFISLFLDFILLLLDFSLLN